MLLLFDVRADFTNHAPITGALLCDEATLGLLAAV